VQSHLSCLLRNESAITHEADADSDIDPFIDSVCNPIA
jgi:hypothetical protein